MRFVVRARMICALLCLVAVPALAQTALPSAVVHALQQAGIPPAAAAVVVHDLDRPAARVRHNADVPMNPASVMKLVTTYGALLALGPAHTWHTEVYAAGPVEDGVLHGDLVLRGSGDPKLTLEAFWRLLREVRARGVREIRGDLVVDRATFARDDSDPGAFDDKPLRPYNVAPDALLVNFKSVRLQFVPSADAQRVDILADPLPDGLSVVNLLQPAPGPCRDLRDVVRVSVATGATGMRLVATGDYPVVCGERQRSFAPLTHVEYVGGLFRSLWRELGGKLEGGVREGLAAPYMQPVASIESPPLSEAVRDINKYSNNVMARQLLLTMGALCSIPAHPQDGDAVLRQTLADAGLAFPELVLENGSGLSRSERIAADSLDRLLVAAYRGPLMPEFMASLPIASVDGTMSRRLSDTGVAGRAHIKTGSLDGVRAAAGYVLDRDGRRHAVVFLVNHPNAAASEAAQDALLECVHEAAC